MNLLIQTIIVKALVFCITAIGLVLIFCQEEDAGTAQFAAHAFFDKALGLGLLACAIRLRSTSRHATDTNK